MLFAYMNLHLISMNTTGLGPWNFLTMGTRMNPSSNASGYISGGPTSGNIVTLQEILVCVQLSSGSSPSAVSGGNSTIAQMVENLQSNLFPLIFGMVGLKIGQKLIRKLGTAKSFNKLRDAVGAGEIVRE